MKRITFFCFAYAVVLSSCTVYMPQTVPIPLMTEKNEVHINGGVTLTPGTYASGTWSPVKNMALQGYAFANLGSVLYSQLALGYYNKAHSLFNYEIYGGAGFGHGTHYYPASGDKNSGHTSGSCNVYFIQGNAGRLEGKKQNFAYGIGLKGGYMSSNLHTDRRLPDEQYINYTYKPRTVLLEPAFFIRYGRNFNVGLQANFSRIYNLDPKDPPYPYQDWNAALTLGYRFKTK